MTIDQPATVASPRIAPPPMWCPIEPAIHPQWTDVEERSIRWLTRPGLCADPVRRRRLVATRSFEWCARVAPNSTLESLQARSEEHTSELQSRPHLVCRLLL